MRARLTTLAEVTGAAAIAHGVFVFSHSAGEVVGGVFLIVGGFLFAKAPK